MCMYKKIMYVQSVGISHPYYNFLLLVNEVLCLKIDVLVCVCARHCVYCLTVI